MYKQGQYIHDSDLKLDREQPMSITASQVRHLLHLLNTCEFSHEARCTIVDLVPDKLTEKLFHQLEGDEDMEDSTDNSSSDEADNTEYMVD